MEIAFDKEKYLKLQKEKILEKVGSFGEKLYIEFGGKMFDDYHASRVLPSFCPFLKIELLESLKNDLEIIFTINFQDIENNKYRQDSGITYELELLKSIEKLKNKDFKIAGVVITKYENKKSENKINSFISKLKSHKIKVYKNYLLENYPFDLENILSEKGFGKNDYFETSKKIIVVTAPGANSGKLSFCLSQIYNDKINGIKSLYAKFETFPVWNLDLKHPLNLAYEAATADIDDVNMIDNFHLEAYGVKAINYNRDLALFPILKKILDGVFDKEIYKSPTDMGINMIGYCITNENLVEKACKDEIIRRYLNAKVEFKLGKINLNSVEKIKLLMDFLNISENDRKIVKIALEKAILKRTSVISIELKDSTILTGKSGDLMTAPAALVLNSLKYLSGINDDILLLSSSILETLLKFKKETFKSNVLTLNEVLIALNISAQTNPMAEIALKKLSELDGTNAHSSHILNPLDQKILKNLGINYTSEDIFNEDLIFDID